MSPYSVVYRTPDGERRIFCTYARSREEARLDAIEMISAVHENPHLILHIIQEAHDFDW